MSDWPSGYQVIIIIETEPVFYLPTIKTGLHDFSGCPNDIIGDDDILTEHRLLSGYGLGVFSETH
jgi:hypothetical protein